MVKGFKDAKGNFHPIGSRVSILQGNDSKKSEGIRLRRDFKNPQIQSLIFAKKEFTESEAKKWARDHGFKAPKTDVTKNNIRIRQLSPNRIKSGECKIIPFGSDVKAVLCDVK